MGRGGAAARATAGDEKHLAEELVHLRPGNKAILPIEKQMDIYPGSRYAYIGAWLPTTYCASVTGTASNNYWEIYLASFSSRPFMHARPATLFPHNCSQLFCLNIVRQVVAKGKGRVPPECPQQSRSLR